MADITLSWQLSLIKCLSELNYSLCDFILKASTNIYFWDSQSFSQHTCNLRWVTFKRMEKRGPESKPLPAECEFQSWKGWRMCFSFSWAPPTLCSLARLSKHTACSPPSAFILLLGELAEEMISSSFCYTAA